MRKELETPPVVRQGWDDFIKDYNLAVQFGMNALQEKLNAQASGQGQTYRFNKQQVKEMLTSIENNKELDDMLDKSLGLVKRMHEQLQTPRGDNRPELTNQNVLGSQAEAPPRRQYERAPWQNKMDFANDANYQNIQDAFNEFNDKFNQADPQNKDALLNQFKLKLKMDMNKRLEAKLALQDKLTYKPSTPRPKRPGEL